MNRREINAAELLVACLEAEGVEYVFGIPGEETLDLNDALDRSSIRFVPVRHEQAGAYMAGVYGRLTGRPGVCLATLGPGATNLVTAIADAYLDRAPVVALTGQSGLERMHKESHQHIDVVVMMAPITKWNAQVSDPVIIPEAVRKAFKIAATPKRGPTHLELPEDVMAMSLVDAPLPHTYPGSALPAPDDVSRAARILREARRPVALAGNGAARLGAAAALRAFALTTGLRVAETFMGKGLIDADEEAALGPVGLQSGDYELAGFGQADVVVTVGYDLVEHAPSNWNPHGDKRIICIDSAPAETDKYYLPEVELVGDLTASLNALGAQCMTLPNRGGSDHLRDLVSGLLSAGATDDSFPMHPTRILADIRSALGRSDVLVSDVGLHKLWIGRAFPAYEPNTVLIANGLAGMGFAVPAAMAVKLVHPDRQVVAVSGDGGFLMNCQELETASRLGTGFVNVIWENQQFGSIAWKQDRRFGRHFGTDFTNPDFVALAAAFGMPAWRVNCADEFASHLHRALEDPRPSLISVPVEYAPDVADALSLGEATVAT